MLAADKNQEGKQSKEGYAEQWASRKSEILDSMASIDLSNKVTFGKRSERNGRAMQVSGKRIFLEEGMEYMKDLK